MKDRCSPPASNKWSVGSLTGIMSCDFTSFHPQTLSNKGLDDGNDDNKNIKTRPLTKFLHQGGRSVQTSTLSPTNLLPTVGHFRFLYTTSSSVVKTRHQKSAIWVLIPVFNVFSSILSIVFFLRVSCCFLK
jgi:hypothetical protein